MKWQGEIDKNRDARFGGRRPLTDILENENVIRVTADIPGVEESGLTVVLDREMLRVTAAGSLPDPGGKYALIRSEFSPGEYVLNLVVPERVDRGAITASVMSGTLLVEMPKVKESGPIKISVKAD